MNNYTNKLFCLYIEQQNYLSGPLVYNHIQSYFHKQTEQTQMRPDQGLLWCKSVNRRLYEVKG